MNTAEISLPSASAKIFSNSSSLTTNGNARGRRVLVAEDEPHVGRLIQQVLASRFGCHVKVVFDGVEALEQLAVQAYDLVLSDIRMPRMGGVELFWWLRESQPRAAERMIFITGHAAQSELLDAAVACVPALAKPFRLVRLCETCRPFLEAEAAISLSV